MRKTPLLNENFYHIYNRGTDKRTIFQDKEDINRFIESVIEFNTIEPTGGLFLLSYVEKKKAKNPEDNLVEIVAYCLNPNHFHLILYQKKDGGISEFMKRLGGGYTNYFNDKNKRNGVLFQGKFKSAHINSDNDLINLSVYVNLNYKVHKIDQLGNRTPKLYKSSWDEYCSDSINNVDICWKDMILDKLNNKNEYKDFALEYIKKIVEKRHIEKEIDHEKLELE
ncbi:MAG: hypothetical protein US50_C0007G0008 [Candidatus Nomurabacteria bacterium GW2011_GWB1_37_5]|uniref:Transposase IS200-like domain-containing protein n=1 Tax=Candidatus Nomurabacteria bacterium GW2011_GWB1_37_5 TaxID=1618742 RepID=A0A0G0HB09_9BACT|nr:MAG: hypothetical protein US50_C0007G0008 [Candidatus Nomurabacteria bacterium GW2011_GWB1_37_5]